MTAVRPASQIPSEAARRIGRVCIQRIRLDQEESPGVWCRRKKLYDKLANQLMKGSLGGRWHARCSAGAAMSKKCLVTPIASSLSALVFAVGCSSASNASPSEPPRAEPAPTSADGVVKVAQASRKFIRVEPAALKENAAVLRAPARVAFPDGAVSRVGAPLAGRVERVHVRTGDRVRPGDPLVTLDCPEAASIRAALSAARAAQREARATVERHARMMERGVGTERELLEAERRLTEAEAELSRALAAARFVGDNSGTTVVLRSPIAGSIVGRNVTVGAAVD